MKINKKSFLLIFALMTIFIGNSGFGQDLDSFFVFKNQIQKEFRFDTSTYRKAWGLDVSASDNGFGMGLFYRYQYSELLYGFASLNFSESKDANEVEYYDYWGNVYSPGKVNRVLMMPIFAGAEYRIFKDVIVETFRPYITGAVGPVVLFTTPYDKEYFSSLKYGQAHYTVGGYVGIGSSFGFDRKNLMGVNIKYYFIPYPKGIQIIQDRPKKNFGGIYITLTFGIMY